MFSLPEQVVIRKMDGLDSAFDFVREP